MNDFGVERRACVVSRYQCLLRVVFFQAWDLYQLIVSIALLFGVDVSSTFIGGRVRVKDLRSDIISRCSDERVFCRCLGSKA